MAVPNIFGTATAAIPLSNLDTNFATPITLGNTAIQLGNTVTTLNNMTLANVTISGGTSSITSNSISNGTSNVSIASANGAVTIATNGNTAVTVDTSQNMTISSDQISSATSHVASQHAMVLRSATTNQRSVVAVAPNGSGGAADFCVSSTNDLQTNYNQVRIGSDGTGFFAISEKGGTETLKSLRFGVGSTALTIDTSNNVGIGTSSPDTILNIQGIDPTFLIQDSDESGDGFIKFQTANGTQRAFIQAAMTANVMLLGVGTSEAMRINSSGNVLMGTTSLIGGDSGRLSIDTGGGLALLANRTGDGNIVRWYREGSNVGNINVTAGGTAYNTSSDYRLKNSIAPITGALEKVALLKPCTYKWNADGSDGQGFIAHELAEVVPNCVTGEKDAVEIYTDEDGNEATRPAYQSIDTSFLVATLTAAIQEQQALITSLTSRIAALEAK
jgi:hypothetical protein